VSEVRIAAEPRTEFGKGAARRTRRAGRVPAVLYGHGSDPLHLTLPGHDLMLALKTPNVLLTLELEGRKELALPRDVQRDPLKGFLEHVDLLLVERGEKVEVEIPIHISGTLAPGGLLTHEMDSLPVRAEATHIPESVELSIEGLAVGASIHAKDVTLPAGTELVAEPEAVVIHVVSAPTAEQVEAELAGAEAEAGIEKDAPTEPTEATETVEAPSSEG
jgi:large subunit ribosomal protein L25